MTFSEFEYWLDGYKEGMHEKPPTEKQWKKIQKKLKEVAPGPHYQWPYYHHYINTQPVYRPYWMEWTSDTTSIPCSTSLNFKTGTNTITTTTKPQYTLTAESLRC